MTKGQDSIFMNRAIYTGGRQQWPACSCDCHSQAAILHDRPCCDAESDAIISGDGVYRYRLWRVWSHAFPIAVFCMLNPSTASTVVNDATIRKCMAFARRWGCGGIEVVNLFALRSRDPKRLKIEYDPIGPENNAYLRESFRRAKYIVAGWGRHASQIRDPITKSRRDEEVFALAGKTPFMCLVKNLDGSPQHPLYIPLDTPLVQWSPP